MKRLLQLALSLTLAAQALAQSAGPTLHRRVRTKSLLINPPGLSPLPTLQQATKAADAVGLDLDNIQGDILIGMKKNQELFLFFSINNATAFKAHLSADIVPLITTTTQLLSTSTQPLTMLNIAFSKPGLDILGVGSFGDTIFDAGQEADALNLNDPGTTNWVPQFLGQKIHGVMLFGSDTTDNINSEVTSVTNILGDSITEQYRLQGAARPGDQQGHEHFGFKDGISQPVINGFSNAAISPSPEPPLDPGHILLNETGDTTDAQRPAWAKDGSILAFRQLKQLVPEFNGFLENNPFNMSADLLGARMVGRWKSGAPVDLAPDADDLDLANDQQRNNFFNFSHPGKNIANDQDECPFSAHIRKTNPRADLSNGNFVNHIIRAGIPYGPEVTPAEAASGISDDTLERGLAFVAYQSDLNVGFHFLQSQWANQPSFVFGKNVQPGFDPIIGANQGQARPVVGLNKNNTTQSISLTTDFVVSRGGEYFFSPSLDALRTTLST